MGVTHCFLIDIFTRLSTFNPRNFVVRGDALTELSACILIRSLRVLVSDCFSSHGPKFWLKVLLKVGSHHTIGKEGS